MSNFKRLREILEKLKSNEHLFTNKFQGSLAVVVGVGVGVTFYNTRFYDAEIKRSELRKIEDQKIRAIEERLKNVESMGGEFKKVESSKKKWEEMKKLEIEKDAVAERELQIKQGNESDLHENWPEFAKLVFSERKQELSYYYKNEVFNSEPDFYKWLCESEFSQELLNDRFWLTRMALSFDGFKISENDGQFSKTVKPIMSSIVSWMMSKSWRGARTEETKEPGTKSIFAIQDETTPIQDFGTHYLNFVTQANAWTSFFHEQIDPYKLANMAFDNYKSETENQLGNFTKQYIMMMTAAVALIGLTYSSMIKGKLIFPTSSQEAKMYHKQVNLSAAVKDIFQRHTLGEKGLSRHVKTEIFTSKTDVFAYRLEAHVAAGGKTRKITSEDIDFLNSNRVSDKKKAARLDQIMLLEEGEGQSKAEKLNLWLEREQKKHDSGRF
jgi:hypothetical protein